jgi:hypothetical protein
LNVLLVFSCTFFQYSKNTSIPEGFPPVGVGEGDNEGDGVGIVVVAVVVTTVVGIVVGEVVAVVREVTVGKGVTVPLPDCSTIKLSTLAFSPGFTVTACI